MKRLEPLTVDLDGTHLIEASAGTGKTYTIALLVVRFVVERKLSIAEILVVTYTIAATAELRSRIRARLREAIDALDSLSESGGAVEDELLRGLVEKWRVEGIAGEARVRLEIALREFDEAPIFTIHGFCQRVLQEHAFESGVPFGAELIPVQAPLENEIVHDLWRRALDAEPADVARRVAPKIGLGDLRKLVRLALSKRRARFLPENGDDRVRILRWIAEEARVETRLRKEATNTQSFDDLLYELDAALAADEASGGRLAARIREEFGAALIDEFQDTDVVQLDIFRRIFSERAPLFLIGDPKQSIYWFRGADLYAYLDARKRLRPTEHTLGSNWRSDPGLVAAVNALFGATEHPFVVEGIAFDAVKAEMPRRLEGLRAAPLRFLFVERTPARAGKSGVITKGAWANEQLATAVAAEVRRLLDGGATIESKEGKRRVGPGDVAIICRTNKTLRDVREALRSVGIPAVIQGATSVFDDPEAAEMERVVAALAEPSDARVIRSALATSLLGLTGDEIFALGDDEAKWDEWVECFRTWHATWLRRGFAAAFREMLDRTGAYRTLAGTIGGERRLTNFLHLAELVQATELASRRGPGAIVEWLREMRENADARGELGEDVAQVRLESDVHAVKLVTIHKSKGLEWPIVVCPDLWQGGELFPDEKLFPRHHRVLADGSTELVIHLGGDLEEAKEAALRESVEERLRLLYVAVTRAKHHCTIFWGCFYGGETSALGVLLYLRDWRDGIPLDVAKRRFEAIDDATMIAVLEELARKSRKAIGVERLVEQRVLGYGRAAEDVGALAPRRLDHAIRDDWRTSSFTALVRAGVPLTRLDEEGLDRDQTTVVEAEPAPLAAPEIALHDFPAGPNAGNCVHLLLEKIDFAAADAAAIEKTAAELLPRFGLSTEWASRLGPALARLLDTKLPLGGERFALRAVGQGRRRSEMKFFLPVGALDPARLAEAFRRHEAPAADPTYATRLAALGFDAFAGFLQGAIDLVFEHGGRWWVVDWKSNHLGVRARDYAPERLAPEMSRHDYFLQAHLYAVAVDRHLRLRVPRYDYDRHFGGVAYLFVRGIFPDQPSANGVFFERPSRALIEELSSTLAGRRRAA